MLNVPGWAYLLWAASPVIGFVAGRYYERHKENLTMRDFVAAYNGWYARWAPIVTSIVALVAVIGVVVGASASVTNGRQDARANATFAAVQKCFDRYAEAQSASSKAVRDASVAKDEAQSARDDALNAEGRAFKAVVRKIIADTLSPADVQWLYDTLDARDAAGRRLDRAQAELDRARAQNPVPSAPSSFCSVKP